MAYSRLASVLVRHAYFGDEMAKGVYLTADAATQRLMQRFGILLREEAQRIALYIPAPAKAGLWSDLQRGEAGMLNFGLHSRDPACAYYTDLHRLPDRARYTSSTTASGELELSASQVATDRASISRLAEIGIALNPLGCAHENEWAAQPAPAYQLELPVRRTVWKYLMLAQDEVSDMRLVDIAGEVDFTAPELTELDDGHRAVLIRSRSAIALQERPPHRFQLRKRVGNSDRVLIPRLPMATPTALQRELIDGELCDVSEIFVNR